MSLAPDKNFSNLAVRGNITADKMISTITRTGMVDANNAIITNLSIGSGDAPYTLPLVDGTPGQVLQTDGAGQSVWADSPVVSISFSIQANSKITETEAPLPLKGVLQNTDYKSRFFDVKLIPSSDPPAYQLYIISLGVYLCSASVSTALVGEQPQLQLLQVGYGDYKSVSACATSGGSRQLSICGFLVVDGEPSRGITLLAKSLGPTYVEDYPAGQVFTITRLGGFTRL